MMWIDERFFARACQQPDHLAVVFQQEQFTYGELAIQAERIAHKLMMLIGQPGRVALYLSKSPQALIMMLACLRAGITYIPIDPKCPAERRNLILADCQTQLLVLDAATAAHWHDNPASIASLTTLISPERLPDVPLRQITWAQLRTSHPEEKQDRVQGPVTAATLAYILYTSGSTGVPKGVMITHENAAAFVDWGYTTFDLTADDHVAVHAPLHFDLPVFDIYVGLAKGATLYLIDEMTVLFPEAVYRFLQERAITILYAVPSALIALLLRSTLATQTLPTLRLLLYAGEEFYPEHLKTLMSRLPAARVFNLYGPIETNVVTSFEVKRGQDWPRIPLGFPLFNTRLFLVKDGHILLEEGEGEIVISGPGVTAGYLNDPEHTQASRCKVQIGENTWLCHRTGDFAYRDATGLLHFLGRRDGMIKTRGFRVELAEVEAALLKHPSVAFAAVVPLPHPIYTHLLYAFVVLGEHQEIDEAELMQELRKTLPTYMCPQRLFFRASLPTTSTGKLARRLLIDEIKNMPDNE